MHVFSQSDEILCELDRVCAEIDADDLGSHALGYVDEPSIPASDFQCDSVREFVGPKFTLSTKPRMRVSIDGEVARETPLEISAVPDAVTIAVPRET